MKKTQLQQRVDELKSISMQTADEKKARHDAHVKSIKERLINDFEARFEDELDVLKEENITYEAGMNDERYEHHGTFIKFTRGDKMVKMDFHNACSFRYEHTGENNHGTMVYGNWDNGRFLLFLHHNLIGDDRNK